jgi:hypothetical protein
LKHSLTSNSEVKNEWSLISAPLYAFMAWTGNILLFLFFSSIKTERTQRKKIYNFRVSKRNFLCQYYVQAFPLLPEEKLKSLKH